MVAMMAQMMATPWDELWLAVATAPATEQATALGLGWTWAATLAEE